MSRLRPQNSRIIKGQDCPFSGMQRVHEWVEDSIPWAVSNNQPDLGVPPTKHGRGESNEKLKKFRAKQIQKSANNKSSANDPRNLAPRQQRLAKNTAPQYQDVPMQPRTSLGRPLATHLVYADGYQARAEPPNSKRYAPPRLQRKQHVVHGRSSDWERNTPLKQVFGVFGGPNGGEFYQKFNGNVKCELKSGAKRVRHGGRVVQNARYEEHGDALQEQPAFDESHFEELMKNYNFMASFMSYQYNMYMRHQNEAPEKAAADVMPRNATFEGKGPTGEGVVAEKSSSEPNSVFNEIVKSTTGHDMSSGNISLGAPVSPLSATSPSENSSLPSELYECCAGDSPAPKVAQSTARKAQLTKNSIAVDQPRRNTHPNSPYYRSICNIASPFGKLSLQNDGVVPQRSRTAEQSPPRCPLWADRDTSSKRRHSDTVAPANSSMLSTGKPAAGQSFNSTAMYNGAANMSSGYGSGLFHDQSAKVNVKRPSLDSVDSSKFMVGESVVGDCNVRKVTENNTEHVLKKTYGEFYCRACDRSWCSKNVWVLNGTRTVYIKRTCNECHKVIEPWFVSK